MTVPETRYARSGDVVIAYQVLGEGPFDVVFIPGSVSHVEVYWEAAGVAALLRGVAAHARVMCWGVISTPTLVLHQHADPWVRVEHGGS